MARVIKENTGVVRKTLENMLCFSERRLERRSKDVVFYWKTLSLSREWDYLFFYFKMQRLSGKYNVFRMSFQTSFRKTQHIFQRLSEKPMVFHTFSLLCPNATDIPKGLGLCPARRNGATTLSSPATHQSLQFLYLQHLLDLPLQKLLDGTPAPKWIGDSDFIWDQEIVQPGPIHTYT